MSDSNTKLSDKENDVSNESKGKWVFKQCKLGKKKVLPLPQISQHLWKCSKMRDSSSER